MTTQTLNPPTARPRARRSRLLAWFFRSPVFMYRIGLAEQLGRSTLLLTTCGRKTGRVRTTPLGYLQHDGLTYVVAGMGSSSDWLKNLLADPHVQVQVGRRRFAAEAEVLTDPAEQRRILELWAEQNVRTAPPPAVQNFMRLLGFDYEGSIRKHLEEDPPPPIVALYAAAHAEPGGTPPPALVTASR